MHTRQRRQRRFLSMQVPGQESVLLGHTSIPRFDIPPLLEILCVLVVPLGSLGHPLLDRPVGMYLPNNLSQRWIQSRHGVDCLERPDLAVIGDSLRNDMRSSKDRFSSSDSHCAGHLVVLGIVLGIFSVGVFGAGRCLGLSIPLVEVLGVGSTRRAAVDDGFRQVEYRGSFAGRQR